MKFQRSLRLAGLISLLACQSAWADSSRIEALARTTLVLEDERTTLSLFNLGNAAGAVWLPHTSRLDLQAQVTQESRLAGFASGSTGPVLDTSGNTLSAVIDTFGNTLLPYTQYTRRNETMAAALEPADRSLYGGIMLWPSDDVMVQIDPNLSRLGTSTDVTTDSALVYSGGGTFRAVWAPATAWAVGIGGFAGSGHVLGRNIPGWTPAFVQDPAEYFADRNLDASSWGLEASGAWRQLGVFDPQDTLDLGLVVKGARAVQTGTLDFSSPFLFAGATPGVETIRDLDVPWDASVAGVYRYLKVMDVALAIGYHNDHRFRMQDTGGPEDIGPYLKEELENWDYELSLRIRLPMVREDDLRFGVVFNNHNLGNPYADGHLLRFLPDGTYSQSPIETVASSIGIGGAFIPAEGSIVTLEYYIGTAKTRQAPAIIAQTGSSRFSLGVQYSLLEGLFLRLGYQDQIISLQDASHPDNPITQTRDESSFRFGTGIQDGPCTVDFTVILTRVAYSPEGWTQLDKPAGVPTVEYDSDKSVTGMVNLTWKY